MPSKVYFTKEITPESLIKIYEKLWTELTWNVWVKVSTWERGSKWYLKAELIWPLVKKLNWTIIECNTAYPWARTNAVNHKKVAEEHWFTSYAKLDIMDEEWEMKIPVKNGRHLKYDIVWTHLKNYDCMLNLAHGKWHQMWWFWANLKNQSIWVASRNWKAYIHAAWTTEDPDEVRWNLPEQIAFIESMAEAATAVADYFKEQNKPILYITVMNALSLDCDCAANQWDPVMWDLWIIGSLDPVANDQVFVDMIWESKDPGAKLLQERIDRQLWREILPYAESLWLWTRDYELVNIDE